MTKGEKTAPCDEGENTCCGPASERLREKVKPTKKSLPPRPCEEAKPTKKSRRESSLTASLRAARRDGERMIPCVSEFEQQMQLGEEGMAAYRNTLRALAK